MQKIIARVLSRLGLESAIKTKVFDSGELVIASDTPRVVVGDGVTLGGRSLSINLALTTDLTTIKDNVYSGDFIFYKNQLYRSNVSGYTVPDISLSDLTSISSAVDEMSLSRDANGIILVKDAGITPAMINSSILGNGLTRTTSTAPIDINLDPAQFSFDGGGQIHLTGAAQFPVRYDSPQGLSPIQQQQARENIDAESLDNKGIPLGYASLGADGFVPDDQISPDIKNLNGGTI